MVQIAVQQKSKIQHRVQFIRINGDSKHFPTVKHAFKHILEPIYGCQEKAIKKVEEGDDRHCELMFVEENPLGIIIYKSKLQCEYGIENGLELKTLFLLAPEKNSKKGFGSLLYRRIEQIARDMDTNIIFCTASEKSQQSMKCAIKNGFEIIRSLKGQADADQEYLLVKNIC